MASFKLALLHLQGDPRYFTKYLFVFSDLVSEPPTTSVTTCEKPHYAPDKDFPWQQLENVSTTIFWMPANQQMLWRKAMGNAGFTGLFVMNNSGFSEKMIIATPPKAEIRLSEADKELNKQNYIRKIKDFGKLAGMLVLRFAMGFVALMVIIGVVAAIIRRRSSRPQNR
jgi:hypothetical protein